MIDDDFFIGWTGRLPRAQRPVVSLAAVCFTVAFALLSLALPRGIADPGDGGFDWAAGQQTLRGTFAVHPYPTLWLQPDATHPFGHTVLLSGTGKAGADADSRNDGGLVEASGFMLKRGTLDMLQVDGRVKPLDPAAPAPVTVPLGRWQIGGEICDGKCEAGAMRPGRGLAHRACANLCLIGGIPPVLVSTGPIEGTTFLLLSGPDGDALPDRMHALVGLPVSLKGAVERRGDLLILRTNLP